MDASTDSSILVSPMPEYAIATVGTPNRSSTEPAHARISLRERLALDCTGGKAGDVLFDEERIENRHGDRTEECRCHQRAPRQEIAAHQFRQHPNGNRAAVVRGGEHERIDELVPRE